MTLYNLRSSDGDYRITKFDTGMNPESSYITSYELCECPAGVRPSCRHRQMLPQMLAHNLLDSPDFWDFENGMIVPGFEGDDGGDIEGTESERVPEWSNGPDCKSGASSLVGSNPTSLTTPFKRRF